MKKTYLIVTGAILGNFIVFFSSLVLANDTDKLISIGRGTKLVVIQDIEVPANQNYVDFPVLKVRGPEYGLMNWIQYTYVCRLELRESSLDRRILAQGTEIVLTGEFEEDTKAQQPYGTVQGLLIGSPAALQSISCGGYGLSQAYNSDGSSYAVGKPFGPATLSIGDFKALFSAYLRVEQPAPLIIHHR